MAVRLRTLSGVGVRGKRVLVRIDVDVPLDVSGKVEPGGDHRLRSGLKTIRYLRGRGARVILCGHLGRPGGRPDPSLRTAPIAAELSRRIGAPVTPLAAIVGPDVRDAVLRMDDGDVVLLENVRFDPREERNDPSFAQELAALGELYVNESFANAHRAHASVVAITEFLPSHAGFHFADEVAALASVVDTPKRPVVAAISGAKLETKMGVVRHLVPKIDALLTGGGVANMFLQAQGHAVGASLVDPSVAEEAAAVWSAHGEKIKVPTDVRVERRGRPQTLLVDEVAADEAILDVGPQTVQRYCNVAATAATLLWNGPLGKAEDPRYRDGTRQFAMCLTRVDAFTVVGGGDTVTALHQIGITEGFDHVSAGGGAMIAFFEGRALPAVEALTV